MVVRLGEGVHIYPERAAERAYLTDNHLKPLRNTTALVLSAEMMCNLLLSWALILTATGPVLSHPITESAEMSYSGPVSLEEGRPVSPDELSLSDQAYLSQRGTNLGYPSLLAGEVLSRDGLRPVGYLPREAVKEVLLEKHRLHPYIRFLGQRRQDRKRGSGSECFWKYCV
ncbi:hypothetical protein SKAU_G00170990 [Synaphobranchus kaupii]|uniref:Uncharacterized protein n=1 Tax=Synaphobranchus kaupii TaxID=118154 RepID=A0A9Q1FKE8_SYNKA|nr:hypothetical protein SKAU_G00170990 [Synaphobranchus kaupii]